MRWHKNTIRFFTLMLVLAFALTAISIRTPKTNAAAAAPASAANGINLYTRPAPNFDLNASRQLKNLRAATNEQLAAVEALKQSTNASHMTVRWNDFGGSPDVLMDFASPAASAGTP